MWFSQSSFRKNLLSLVTIDFKSQSDEMNVFGRLLRGCGREYSLMSSNIHLPLCCQSRDPGCQVGHGHSELRLLFLVPRCAHEISPNRWDICDFREASFMGEGITASPLFSFLLRIRKRQLELPSWTCRGFSLGTASARFSVLVEPPHLFWKSWVCV